jgi:hypothetical protein
VQSNTQVEREIRANGQVQVHSAAAVLSSLDKVKPSECGDLQFSTCDQVRKPLFNPLAL